MLCGETVAVYCENRTEHTDIFRIQMVLMMVYGTLWTLSIFQNSKFYLFTIADDGQSPRRQRF
jgi:hypothetical protein